LEKAVFEEEAEVVRFVGDSAGPEDCPVAHMWQHQISQLFWGHIELELPVPVFQGIGVDGLSGHASSSFASRLDFWGGHSTASSPNISSSMQPIIEGGDSRVGCVQIPLSRSSSSSRLSRFRFGAVVSSSSSDEELAEDDELEDSVDEVEVVDRASSESSPRSRFPGRRGSSWKG